MINDKYRGFSLIEVLVVLALMAFLAAFVGAKMKTRADEPRFERTCNMMEEIKEAIIGKPALYCNGVRQFTGYVSDMGTLPNLFYTDKKTGKAVKVDYDNIGNGMLEVILNATVIVQPKVLWTRDLNGDGDNEIGENVLWEYHETENIWAGWHGPYLSPPPGGVLRDGWGNPFVFVMGELVTIPDPDDPQKRRTFRCGKTHECSLGEPHQPGTADDWEELKHVNDKPVRINAKTWVHAGKDVFMGYVAGDVDAPRYKDTLSTDIYYADAMEIISYGQDGQPGGKGLDKDLVLTIYTQEYTGEVGGHVGYNNGGKRKIYAQKVSLYYPGYTEEGGGIESKTIEIKDTFQGETTDEGYGINFRFGTCEALAATMWECKDCTDPPPPDAGCTCIWRTQGDCLKWRCLLYDYIPAILPQCDGCDPFPCPDGSAGCCFSVCTCDVGCLSKECLEYGLGDCNRWECNREIAGCYCKAAYKEVDDPNSRHAIVPVGIRSIITDTGKTFIFPVAEGGNWVGTVK